MISPLVAEQLTVNREERTTFKTVEQWRISNFCQSNRVGTGQIDARHIVVPLVEVRGRREAAQGAGDPVSGQVSAEWIEQAESDGPTCGILPLIEYTRTDLLDLGARPGGFLSRTMYLATVL